ncbi:aspartyl/asparaginyl beta-hydroxylase domain-containing protein [Sphingosinicella sp. YJ22]|uniref:aspartyl/asparaginyl beta-hydroxylase domain-containing protein n=1 Tax=Sphingosinicella sp. YJ22 TaxID=1104780 RepID=UPI001409C2D8|nr:aspartyl/asparaginyl beta-hydroxylase domain-containing protein [Sphingosinicella sp. YJ22]
MTADEAEIDRRLAADPRDIEALAAKADARHAAGDDRAAAAFYKAVLSAAAAVGGPLPMSLKPIIERAQRGIAAAEGRFEDYLERSLVDAGLPPGSRPPRFQDSLDLLTGRRTTNLQLQQPSAYYYPGLPQRRYYERSELPWAAEIEAATSVIRGELDAWLARGTEGFTPYLVNDPSRPRSDFHGLLDNPAWSTLYIWEKGASVAGLAPHFTRTLAAVEKLALPHITVRAPSVLFSRLGPGARIPPHHGMLNARLICHLPLIVPEGCGFRVGGETRQWEPGKLLVFDDTVEHEAWNDSGEDRIILIFDVWRPELDAAERRAVTALFEAIDSYGR